MTFWANPAGYKNIYAHAQRTAMANDCSFDSALCSCYFQWLFAEGCFYRDGYSFLGVSHPATSLRYNAGTIYEAEYIRTLYKLTPLVLSIFGISFALFFFLFSKTYYK